METYWYEDESWADTPLGTAGTVQQLFPTDPAWVRRWTCYAEFMDRAIRSSDPEDELWEDLGDPHLRIYQELLDPALFRASRASMGRAVLTQVKALIEKLTGDDGSTDEWPVGELSASAREAIWAWHYALQYRGEWKKAVRNWYAAAKPPRVKSLDSAERVMRDRLWRDGLAAPSKYPAMSGPAFRAMTRDFDNAFRQYMRQGAGEDADVVGQLLPACFAQKVRKDAEELKETRGKYSPAEQATLGIDENGHTMLMADALPKLRDSIARKESMLILGPTSSGKSRIGRIAVCHAITQAHKRHGRAIVLLPTKALVNQAVKEWEEFISDTPYKESWRIVAGSRDHPQNDEAIARRSFDIAVMIPEKLAGLMAGGMTLDGIDIIIVDELQNITDEERGPRLEMLLTAIRASYRIPLIGLSATLAPQAVEDIRTWLGMARESVIMTQKRPVPLDYIVCDASSERVRAADGLEKRRDIDLHAMLRRWEDDELLHDRVQKNVTYRRALALATMLLGGTEGDGAYKPSSVLCFVGSREDAERMADIAQAVLDRDPRTPHVDPAANPFRGRFSDLTEDVAKQRYRDFGRYPQTSLRDSVAKSLRTGVGYHTARLDPEMRVEMEKAFRDGLVRLLFATATLQLGINLPADAVVVASITRPTGRRKSRVLSQSDVAQALGRAGRLRQSLRGYGYLVVPEQRPVKARVEFDDEDLRGLAGLMQPTTEVESDLDRALRALVDVDAVFDHYIGNIGDALPGAAISSRVTEQWFATEVLHWAVREGVSFTLAELHQRIDELYWASLGRVTGASPPDKNAIVRLLEKHALIGIAPSARPEMEPSLAVTGLGRAISTAGLPFEDAQMLEELTRAATEGAGDLTLLWLAAMSHHIRRTTSWISIVREDTAEDPKIEEMQRERFRELAQVFAASLEDRVGRAERLSNSAFVKWLPSEDLIGAGEVGDRLRRIIIGPGPEPEPIEVNALLRACALLLWKSGCPFKEIENALQANLEVAIKGIGTRTVFTHTQDVRMLGENASYVFDAARELTGVRPQGTLFRRFEALGESVEFGIPAALAPLVRLPLQGTTHRERVVHLAEVMRNDPRRSRFDSLADLVDRFMRRPKQRPADRGVRERLSRITISDSDRKLVREHLLKMEHRRGKGTWLPDEFRDWHLPGTDTYTLPEALERLRKLDPDNTPSDAAYVMRRFGLEAAQDAEGGLITLTSALRPELQVRMLVRTTVVTIDDLNAARGYADVILACAGATDGVRAADLSPRGDNPVVIQPSILLEAAARIGQIVVPHDDHDDQSAPLVSDYDFLEAEGGDGDATDDAFDEGEWDPSMEALETSSSDRPQAGYEAVGHRLLQMLVAAPPILARTELNRLMAGMTVAPPPALAADFDDRQEESADGEPSLIATREKSA